MVYNVVQKSHCQSGSISYGFSYIHLVDKLFLDFFSKLKTLFLEFTYFVVVADCWLVVLVCFWENRFFVRFYLLRLWYFIAKMMKLPTGSRSSKKYRCLQGKQLFNWLCWTNIDGGMTGFRNEYMLKRKISFLFFKFQFLIFTEILNGL